MYMSVTRLQNNINSKPDLSLIITPDIDYDNEELLNIMIGDKQCTAVIMCGKKRIHKKTKSNILLNKTRRLRRMPNYIQYFILYIFSVMQHIQNKDYYSISRLLYSIFKKDITKFDYNKVIQHFDNIRKRMKHCIKHSTHTNCDKIVHELFNFSVFYNKKYYQTAVLNFKRNYPEHNIILPKINDYFYSSIIHNIGYSLGKSIVL